MYRPDPADQQRLSDAEAQRDAGWPLLTGLAGLLAMAVASVALIALLLDIQVGATAYIVGEGRWSKAQQDAVQHLYRYSVTTAAADLRHARAEMRIPLADRAARLALELDPPDLDAARAGLLAGRNPPANIERMIWMHRNFADAPYFRDAIAIWRTADVHLLRLVALAEAMEAAVQAGSEAELAALRRELVQIDATLRPLEDAFSMTLAAGVNWLRWVLFVTGAVLFLLMLGGLTLIVVSATRRLQASERRFRAAFRQAGVGMAKIDPDGAVLDVNEALSRILRLPRKALLSAPLQARFAPGSGAEFEQAVAGLSGRPGSSVVLEQPLLRGDGGPVWCKLTLSSVSTSGRATRILLIVEDVSEARRLSREIAWQASHDALTGLVNRREIQRRLERALASAKRDGARHALALIDLDQFKLVNDSCGHLAGDELLKRVSGRLAASLRDTDSLARLGGDEFAVLLEDVALDDASRVADKLLETLAELRFDWEGHSFNATGSIGLVAIDASTPDVTWLLRAADTACYLAKDVGRNRCRIYVESDQEVSLRRGQMAWVGEIDRALEADRLRLHAQAMRPLRPGGGTSCELLVRLVDANGDEHPPGAFLPAAERYGRIAAIDRQVVRMAFGMLAAHRDALERLELVHINLSAQSVADAGFREELPALIDRYRMPAERLCFEMTETAVISSLSEARAFFDALRARGARLALDDFGSGLSSFAYLKNLPFDILKIDGVFVRDVAADPVDRAIVGAMAELARVLGKRTVAEWVETPEVLEILSGLGIDWAQGYAIHRPQPLEAFLEDMVAPAVVR